MDRDELDLLSAQLVEGGAEERGVADVIATLKESGCSIVESLYMISKVFSLSLADAKAAVMTGPSWSKESEDHEEFHEKLIEGFEREG
ncbi:hypothetical protein [Streptosporangium carneum]|uniref:Uncharacterized protein n=1 Tax=Streptosporangium carneum TaxID=47481 RepID=A0A9W6I701_9ACTN|nr:hypothetical protein [Streptosporangium carneum]GLK13230.1 hypothetical protein GCM10017600_66410 [Streptosporangium carneum]